LGIGFVDDPIPACLEFVEHPLPSGMGQLRWKQVVDGKQLTY